MLFLKNRINGSTELTSQRSEYENIDVAWQHCLETLHVPSIIGLQFFTHTDGGTSAPQVCADREQAPP